MKIGSPVAWRLDGDDEHLVAVDLDVGWMPPRLAGQGVFRYEVVDVRRVQHGPADDAARLRAGEQVGTALERARGRDKRAVPEAEDVPPGVEPLSRVVEIPAALPLDAVGLRLARRRVADRLDQPA